MTIRGKYRVAIVIGVAGIGVLAGLTYAVAGWFIAPLLVLFVAVGIYMTNLRCPNCGYPAFLGGQGNLYWRPWIPQQCVSCRAELK